MFLKIIRCVLPRCKAAGLPRAITPVVATPLFGRLSSAELCGQPPLSSLYYKLQSISLREFSSISPAVSHIPPTAKDDDAIAPPAVAAEQYMPEEWPDFSKMKVDPDVEKNSLTAWRRMTWSCVT